MKGGHFDKFCELHWARGNFLADQGLSELLKSFSQASESRVIPDKVPRRSIRPPVRQLCQHRPRESLGNQHIGAELLSCFLLSLPDPWQTMGPISSPWWGRKPAGSCAGWQGPGGAGEPFVRGTRGRSGPPVSIAAWRGLHCCPVQGWQTSVKVQPVGILDFCRPYVFCHNYYSSLDFFFSTI